MFIKPVILAVAGCVTLMCSETAIDKMRTLPLENNVTIQQEFEEEQNAMIKRPENYVDSTFYSRLVIVGDSRTVGMRDCVGSDVDVETIWCCKGAMGYNWMTGTGIPQVEQYITDNTAVIILMGVNDMYNIKDYVNYANNKAQEWKERGADTYFAAVGPVDGGDYVTNEQIEAFNVSLKTSLAGVDFIDMYSHMVQNGYGTIDGVHYTADTYRELYKYLVNSLDCDNGGNPDSIWG